MIRLRTLGTIALEDERGAELAPVLRQPKRFALLIYLVLARPRGFQRRDILLGLFWPELDAERARGALRQALYILRRSLPEGVLVTRGDEEVGVDGERLWCDVHEFERALEEDRAEAALELYRGDLLEGFHVPVETSDLEYWLTAERERLRGKALQAAREAAAAAEGRGDMAAALAVAERAARLAPLDEGVARHRMELLHRTGDNAAAVLVYERWSARLREELDVEPSHEIRARVEELRHPEETPAGTTRPAPEPTVRPTPTPMAVPGPQPAPQSTPRQEPKPALVREPVPAPRRSRWVVAGTALLVLALAIGALTADSWWPAGSAGSAGSASSEAERVIVLPFSYRGGAESSYLSEGLVYLFSVALDGEDLRSVDPHTVVRRAAADAPGEYDPESGAALAGRLGADLFILGDVVETEGALQMTGRLYEAGRGGAQLRGSSTATGPTTDLPRLVDQVAREILTQRPGSSISRMSRLAGVTTPSLPGLKAYLRGERLLREARFSDAITAFGTAVEADSLFALAHYRMSLAASWAFRGDLASSAAAKAVRHADRLPERERRLLEAHAAYRRGEAPQSAEMLRRLSEDYPEDPEVWYRLGEVLLHFGPPNGWSILEAADPFRRAIELEPLLAEVQYHLAQIETAAGRPDSARAWVDRALDIAPDGARSPQLRVLRTALDPRGAGWPERLRELRDAGGFTLVSATYNAAVFARQPERGLAIAALLTQRSRPMETRVLGHILLAELELALGRGERAREQLAVVRELDPAGADVITALLAEAPAGAPLHDDLGALASRLLAAAQRSGRIGHSSPWLPDEGNPRLAQLYAAGRLSGLLDDRDGLDRATRGLRSLTQDSLLAWSLATDLDLLRDPAGDPAATTDWQPAALHVSAEMAVLSPVFSRPARRYQYARALERAGRLREALEWYEVMEMFSVHDLPWAIPALEDRARVQEALGDPAAAAALRQRLAGIRGDAAGSVARR